MNWLARLKKIETVLVRDATKTTKTTKSVSVVSIAPDIASMPKTGGDSPAANDPSVDPDCWCWPHTAAMNCAEINTFTARLARFTDKGLSLDDADASADKLVLRDRDLDDRRLCLECVHLSGGERRGWGCRNWQQSGVANRARDAQLSAALVYQFQRCDGFKEANA